MNQREPKKSFEEFIAQESGMSVDQVRYVMKAAEEQYEQAVQEQWEKHRLEEDSKQQADKFAEGLSKLLENI